MSDKTLLGTGQLGWFATERRTDRYGAVALFDGEGIVPLTVVDGKGSLVASVVKTRQSPHIGDLFHGFFPSTPNVGDEIELGSGTVFFEDGAIGLRPDDDEQYTFWLNPHKLYLAIDQDVELYFVTDHE